MLPRQIPIPGGFSPDQEWYYNLTKSSSASTGVLGVLGLLIKLLPLFFHFDQHLFADSLETPN